MIAIVHSIYSQSVHALALNAELIDNDAERYCILILLINIVFGKKENPLILIQMTIYIIMNYLQWRS